MPIKKLAKRMIRNGGMLYSPGEIFRTLVIIMLSTTFIYRLPSNFLSAIISHNALPPFWLSN